MKDGMMAAGIITSGEWLDGVKGKQALDALERYKGGEKMPEKRQSLKGGMDYKQLGMSNQDAEWLASRRFSIEDIARMFNVSPIFSAGIQQQHLQQFQRGKPRVSDHDNAPVAGELRTANQGRFAGGFSRTRYPLSG